MNRIESQLRGGIGQEIPTNGLIPQAVRVVLRMQETSKEELMIICDDRDESHMRCAETIIDALEGPFDSPRYYHKDPNWPAVKEE